MLNTHYDKAGSKCSGGAMTGAVELRQEILKRFAGAKNLGIYNCRSVRGRNSLSLHGEGRAIDIGGTPDVLQKVAHWAANYSQELGVQEVIYNRQIWSAQKPNDGWRYYSGADAHDTHVHIGMTWAGAQRGSAKSTREDNTSQDQYDTNYAIGEYILIGGAIAGIAALTTLAMKYYGR